MRKLLKKKIFFFIALTISILISNFYNKEFNLYYKKNDNSKLYDAEHIKLINNSLTKIKCNKKKFYYYSKNEILYKYYFIRLLNSYSINLNKNWITLNNDHDGIYYYYKYLEIDEISFFKFKKNETLQIYDTLNNIFLKKETLNNNDYFYNLKKSNKFIIRSNNNSNLVSICHI